MRNEQIIEDQFDEIFQGDVPRSIDCYCGPIDYEAVIQASNKIQLDFPTSYRVFLQRFGVAIYWSYEIHGLFSEEKRSEFAYLDVVDRTHSLRETLNYKMVDNSKLISVANDQDGVRFYFDLNYSTNGEPPVVATSGYFGPTIVAPDFIHFLRLVVESNEKDNIFGLY